MDNHYGLERETKRAWLQVPRGRSLHWQRGRPIPPMLADCDRDTEIPGCFK
jgi:hypothetical protein